MKEWEYLHVTKQDEKRKYETEVRDMWRTCFGDPFDYEAFYFQNVYPANEVLCIMKDEMLGMLHLNPYECRIQESRQLLHYIVGVATKEQFRRQGIMRRLLEHALRQMYQNKEAITYLMPADVAYYEPFSFVEISKEQRACLTSKREKGKKLFSQWEEGVFYVSYASLNQNATNDVWNHIVEKIDVYLDAVFDTYTVRSRSYFELLYQEKKCQNGDVIFVFRKDDQECIGYFAYAKQDEKIVVEQMVYEGMSLNGQEGQEKWLFCVEQYLSSDTKVEIVHAMQYMVRIVDVLACLKLFKNYFERFASNKKVIRITDSLLTENEGLYAFYEENGEVCVTKVTDASLDDVLELTVADLAKMIFCSEEQIVCFAEVV
ncbi:MAG: GNAT family N-acetyltransferase [Eubacteriales bacterium]|nr:GNAT family N-acetyltransferase [Eubacteriales bacterium]